MPDRPCGLPSAERGSRACRTTELIARAMSLLEITRDSARVVAISTIVQMAAGHKLAYACCMKEQHRNCKCGAVYHRTEAMAPAREVNSFECIYCGDTLESWKSAWVPTYRLVVGPIIKPSPS